MDSFSNDVNLIIKGLANLETVDGLSFAGKQLKLENEIDAKPIIEEIEACKNLQYLNLEGNSLGVNAAKAIAKALSQHQEFKRAIWKDMFTGRMKDEIPKALMFLGSGLATANASLVELDLSDNAFGPIGMEGLVSLLKSTCCHALRELKLNNNGLGITGAKLLSKTLIDSYNKSNEKGKPLGLRVFIAGRNRLENEGAIALAEVFEKMGTLEELMIPQNGIYFKGITRLCQALKCNKNLRVLNLNDNTVGPKGCEALASTLPELKQLISLNLGDCLIRTKGAVTIAKALKGSTLTLQELIVDFNEIRTEGGIALAAALQDKPTLSALQMDGNKFGEDGRLTVQAELEKSGQLKALVSLEEDNEDSEEDEEEEEEEEDDNDEDDDDDDEKETSKKVEKGNLKVNTNGNKFATSPSPKKTVTFVKPVSVTSLLENISAEDFLAFPTPERFFSLNPNKAETILKELKVRPEGSYLEALVSAIMKVSTLTSYNVKEIRESALICTNALYREVFTWAEITRTSMSLVSNCLLVHLGLIKSEDKSWKIPYNKDQCREAVKLAMAKDFFPADCRETLTFFLNIKKMNTETITL